MNSSAKPWRVKRRIGNQTTLDSAPRCGALVRVIAEVTDPDVIVRILEHVQARGSDRKLSRQ